MENSRIIEVYFLSQTETKPNRIVLKESRLNLTDRVVLSSNSLSIAEQAINYLKKIGVNVTSKGWINQKCILVSNSWDNGKGFINIKGETS